MSDVEWPLVPGCRDTAHISAAGASMKACMVMMVTAAHRPARPSKAATACIHAIAPKQLQCPTPELQPPQLQASPPTLLAASWRLAAPAALTACPRGACCSAWRWQLASPAARPSCRWAWQPAAGQDGTHAHARTWEATHAACSAAARGLVVGWKSSTVCLGGCGGTFSPPP